MLQPDLVSTLLYIVLSLALVGLNGFFVAAEFAIVKVRRTRLKELAGQGVATARVSILMVDELDEYLSATQLGITIVSLGLGWIGEASFFNLFALILPQQVDLNEPRFHGIALVVSFFIITLLHVVLGELVPKSMAIQRAEKITLLIARPLRVFYNIFRPLIMIFTTLSNGILKVFGFQDLEEDGLSEEELKMVLQNSHEDGVITESEAEIIRQAFHFSDKRAVDIMIPEHQIQCVSLKKSFDENILSTRLRMYSRFPLVRDNFQDVIGIVHIKDLLAVSPRGKKNNVFKSVAREPVFVDAYMRQDKIMRIFKEKKVHLAIVRNSKTKENLGIVTLEDILEELVGDIVDEHGN